MPTTDAPRQTHPAPRPRAILWDMDGTLIDTEPYWMEAERDLVESYGGTWSEEQAFELVGNALPESGRIIAETTPVPMTSEEIVDWLLQRVNVKLAEHVPWRPGARELLREAREAEMPCALVTMSYLSFAQILIDTLPPGTFEAVVTGDMVARGKPDPEAYLRGAQELALAPADCVAIEDSDTGVLAATAAGVPTIAVPHLVQIPDVPGYVLARSLAEVRLADLPRLVERAEATR